VPRPEYKTITVKVAIFCRFVDAVKEAKLVDPDIDNSTFLEYLLRLYYERPLAVGDDAAAAAID
jgi:hypothetical protein